MTSTASGRRLFWATISLALAVIVVDQATKFWAEAQLGDGQRIPVIGDFITFVLVYNPGAAFSIGSGYTWIFTIITGIAVVVLAWYAWGLQSRAWVWPIGLLLGGATTHFGDRLFRQPEFANGHVVDFIAYSNWFVGNVADIVLFFGVVLMLVLSFTGVPPKREHPVEAADNASME